MAISLSDLEERAKEKIGEYIRAFILDATPEQIVEMLNTGAASAGTVPMMKPKEGDRRVLIGVGGRILGGDLPEETYGKTLGETEKNATEKD